jgi:hypothetical protein
MVLQLKKLKILIVFLYLGTHSMQSQVLLSLIFGDKLNSEGLEFGLEGGLNYSTISDTGNGNRLRDYNLGFYFDVTLKNRLHLDTGVLVKSSMGANNLTEDNLDFLGIETEPQAGVYSQKINYFIVPILLKYNFKNRIYIEGGPEIALMRNAHVEFNFEDNTEIIKLELKNTNKINRIDTGFSLGTGYKLMKNDGMTLGLKYYFGMIDVYKEKSGTKNNSLFLRLNVPIGANAAKKKRENKSQLENRKSHEK